MRSELTLRRKVEEEGFAICDGVLSEQAVGRLLAALERIGQAGSVRRRGGIFAVRNLLEASAEVRELADSLVVRELVEPILGPEFFPVRGIFFDKIPNANWKVPWHQDVTIAVREKVEADGFGPWSVKAGVLHVQPPSFVLERMISVRLHLDTCHEVNGALRVIPASHQQGRIPEEQIEAIRAKVPERICSVEVGGAMLMRPLLLHASSPCIAPGHRRVIHIDFASSLLPNGMRWLYESSWPTQ